MSSIPDELYQEILLRVPVKSLLVCKSVCKNWYDLISSSDFVKLHLEFTAQKNKPILMVEGKIKVLKSIGYDSRMGSEDAVIEMHFPFKSLLVNYIVQLVGSCNGLVCIQLLNCEAGRDSFYLWNPATREYKGIPKVQGNTFYSICALSYDHKTEDYKLAIGVPLGNDNTLVHIYTLASNSWKPAKTVPYQFPNDLQRHGVLVNGDLHWLAQAKSKFFLLSLDISDESFKEVQPLPTELLEKKNPCMTLGMLEGCLCILVDSYVNGTIQLDVWKMLNYGVRECWTRHYIITHESIIRDPYSRLNPMWSFENGKILFMGYGSLVLYDPTDGSAIELNNHDNFTRLAVNYFESLVPLNSGTYVGGEGGIQELREFEEDS